MTIGTAHCCVTGTVGACIVGRMRYKAYPFYVVFKADGRVLAAAEFKTDAEEMRGDLPVAKLLTQVLSAAGVKKKFGAVEWAS